MSTSRIVCCLALGAALAACGDDSAPANPDAGVEPDGGMEPDAGPEPELACGEAPAEALPGGSWDDRFTVAGFTGHDGRAPTVYDFAVDTDGSLIAAGKFDWLGAEAVTHLLRWRDGAWEPARDSWELTPPGAGFAAIAIDESGTLALATNDDFGDRDGEIWVDDGSGLRSIGAFTGQVRSLVWYDGALWAAGTFELAEARWLARWDGLSWSAPPGGAPDGYVYELSVDSGQLLVGGGFSQIGGIAAVSVAGYDGTAWTAFDMPEVLRVYALARGSDGELYAGGALGDLAGAGAGTGGMARWNGSAWEVVGGGVTMYAYPGVVTDLVDHGGSIYATGCFINAGGAMADPDAVASRAIARWDGTAWHALNDGTKPVLTPWFIPNVCGDETGAGALWDVPHQRLASHGDTLLMGGSFSGVDGVLSQSIAALESGSWSAQGPSGLGLGGSVEQLGAGGDDCSLYAKGSFSHAGGEPVDARVLRFAGDSWQPLADPLARQDWCPAFAVSPAGEVVMGCAAGPAGAILRLEGDSFAPLELGELSGVPMAMTYDHEGTLWVSLGGAQNVLARVDGDQLTVVEDGFDGPVLALHADENGVIAGGVFTQVGDLAASNVARFDGSAWSALGDGVPGQLVSVAADGDTVYASSYDIGNGAYLLGAYDGSTWRELASPDANLSVQPYFSFEDIEVVDGAVLLAGSAELDDGSGRGALIYRDGQFSALGGGVNGITVTDVAVAAGEIWVGGTTAEAGSGDSLLPSVGIAHYQLAP